MCKLENTVNVDVGAMKQQLEDDIFVTEKQLAELRMVTNMNTGVELGKARRLGLEVRNIRNNNILLY